MHGEPDDAIAAFVLPDRGSSLAATSLDRRAPGRMKRDFSVARTIQAAVVEVRCRGCEQASGACQRVGCNPDHRDRGAGMNGIGGEE
jgi:hypothetical protein